METFRAVAFMEGGKWHAQCLERDIAASGADAPTLHQNLLLTIAADRAAGIELHGEPYGGIDAAPVEFHELWDRGVGGTPTRIGNEAVTVDIRAVALPWRSRP